MRILLIEKEVFLAQAIASEMEKYSPAIACEIITDVPEGVSYAEIETFAIIYLGGCDSEVQEASIHRIRKTASTPILVQSSENSPHMLVHLLDAGADSVLPSPCHRELVLAHIRALVRRVTRTVVSAYTFGSLTVDTRTKQVLIDGVKLPVTSYQYRILETLVSHYPEMVSHNTMTSRVYRDDAVEGVRGTLRVHISKIRKTLRQHTETHAIVSVYGFGWKLVYRDEKRPS